MNENQDFLLMSAARLYSLGVDLEAKRETLRQLVNQGVSYDSAEMLQAYKDFNELETLWKQLEKEHLALRDGIVPDMHKRK